MPAGGKLCYVKLHYYPDTDTLAIRMADRPTVESAEIAPDVVTDFDVDGNLVGIDIDLASTKVDLTTLETDLLPNREMKVA